MKVSFDSDKGGGVMERLIIDEIIEHCERKTKLYEEIGKSIDFETIELKGAIREYWEHKQVKEYLEELKQYRDAEKQGLLLRLPVKAGDTVYALRYGEENDFIIVETKIIEIRQNINGIFFEPLISRKAYKTEDFGKDVFLTQAEAEQKLKEMEGNHGI